MEYINNIIKLLQEYWQVFLITGVGYTLLLSFVTVAAGSVLGVFLCLGRMAKFKPLNWVVMAIVEVVRGTPMLLQLYIGYFLVPQILPFNVPDVGSAVQSVKFEVFGQMVCSAADLEAGWDIFPDDAVQLLPFVFSAADAGHGHAAADIDADEIGHDLLADGHGEPDRADLAGMHVRHDSDGTTAGNIHVADPLKLGNGIGIDGGGFLKCRKYLCGRIGPLDRFHDRSPFFILYENNGTRSAPRGILRFAAYGAYIWGNAGPKKSAEVHTLAAPFFRILLNCVKNVTVVMAAASVSLTGSARNTAKVRSAKKCGSRKISGISRISFRRQASNRLTFACPSAIKLC